MTKLAYRLLEGEEPFDQLPPDEAQEMNLLVTMLRQRGMRVDVYEYKGALLPFINIEAHVISEEDEGTFLHIAHRFGFESVMNRANYTRKSKNHQGPLRINLRVHIPF